MLSLLLSSKTKTIVKRAFQISILINFHEPLKMEYNIQRPSSSELPLTYGCPLLWSFFNDFNYGYPLSNIGQFLACIARVIRL